MSKPELPTAAVPAGRPVLTAALARLHASADNMLIVTYINYNRVRFAETWVRHLLAENQTHHLVAALDQRALDELESRGVPSYLLDFSTLDETDTGWGTDAFRKLGLFKVQMVLELAKTGVDTLTVDADAFILRDPLPYFRRFANADVLMSSDLLAPTTAPGDDGLETSPNGFGAAFNIGFVFIRARALEFVQAWRDACYRQTGAWDQNLFAETLRRGSDRTFRRAATLDRLQPMFRLKNGRHLLAGVLPVSLFASGHTFFVSRLAHRLRTTPYMVHTTYQYGGVQGKRHRLREAMMWEDERAYYTARMLRYEPDLPRGLVYPRGTPDAYGTVDFSQRTTVDEHFRLVNHQLSQIRDGLALARALGRVLILPRLVCGLDRYWAPHDGIIPGSATKLPLLDCPADHILDLERMRTPESLVREHSILCNPRMPAAVLEGSRTEHLRGVVGGKDGRAARGGGGDDGGDDGDDDDPSGGHVDEGADEAASVTRSEDASARAAALVLTGRLAAEHDATSVLELTGPLPHYRATLGLAAADFERELRGYASLWCCNMPPGGRGPGHIWYDLFWDELPHTDRHNRRWTEAWKPIMGP